MDIKKIKSVIDNETHSDEQKESLIINILAKDKSAIPVVMKILEAERENNIELISDMNLELSRAHIFIDELNPALLPKKEKQTNLGEQFTKNFIIDKISEFYIKYKGALTHCFNRFN
jgi:F0F1-type ATP synthase delta subunit